MKKIDFTHTGGFPLTQDELDYLQSSYTECVNAIAGMSNSGSTPIIISGMKFTTTGTGEISVSDGWFFYNGELVRFYGSVQTTGIGGTVPVVKILPVSSSLTYNDGSIYPAIKDKTAVLVSGLPITDTTHFPYSTMIPFQTGFGVAGREMDWTTIAISTDAAVGGVTGSVSYKLNLLTNTLHIRGGLTANNAQNFAALPYSAYYTMCNIPAGYRPANTAYLNAYFSIGLYMKDDMGVAWIREIGCTLNPAGNLVMNWVRPEVAVTSYSVVFNTIIPLD